MKRLCYGSFLKVLFLCKQHTVAQKFLNGKMLQFIDSNYDLMDDDNAATTMSKCNRNIPPNVVACARTVDVGTIIGNFREEVLQTLDRAKIKTVILAILDILGDDTTIPGDTEIFLRSHRTKSEIIKETVFDPAEFLANIFLYSVINVKSTECKDSITEITAEFISQFDKCQDKISLKKSTLLATPMIGKTIKKDSFEKVFVEVRHSESLPLKNNNELRIFHLNIANGKFEDRDLKRFISRNIGMYVYSRAEIEHFHLQDDVESIGLEALLKLKKYGDTNAQMADDALGNMLLYAFLENVLNAPKIMSKIELDTTAKQYGAQSDGIHLLVLDDGTKHPYHQLVFGSSNIIGDLKSAVDNAFIEVEKLMDNPTPELNVVESTVLGKVFDKNTAEYMKQIIIPNKGTSTIVDYAYGIFLGYTLGIDAASYSNLEFRKAVKDKMLSDISVIIPYIIDRINSMKLSNYSFYFYILPFNDADTDKHNIIRELLTGGVSY